MPAPRIPGAPVPGSNAGKPGKTCRCRNAPSERVLQDMEALQLLEYKDSLECEIAAGFDKEPFRRDTHRARRRPPSAVQAACARVPRPPVSKVFRAPNAAGLESAPVSSGALSPHCGADMPGRPSRGDSPADSAGNRDTLRLGTIFGRKLAAAETRLRPVELEAVVVSFGLMTVYRSNRRGGEVRTNQHLTPGT